MRDLNKLQQFSNRFDLEMEDYIAVAKQDFILEIKEQFKDDDDEPIQLEKCVIKNGKENMDVSRIVMDKDTLYAEGYKWVSSKNDASFFSLNLTNFSLENIQMMISCID